VSTARFDTTFAFAKHRAQCRVECQCGRVRTLTSDDLMALFPMPVPIGEAERRLVCRKCGRRGHATMVPIPVPGR
jgi:hypothetical protein